ncbi:MAG: PLDc N-terminal domain-containing protein [Pirellulaceae bacterium]
MFDNALILAQRGGDPAAGAAIGLCFLLFMLGMVTFAIATAAFHIWMLIDCAIYESKMPDNQIVMWILLIIFLGAIGAVAYYFGRRPYNRPGMGSYKAYQPPPQDPYWRPPY